MSDSMLSALVGAFVVILAGILSWWVQRAIQKRRLRTMLHREMERNTQIITAFWQTITNTVNDQDRIEQYYRFAFTHLPAWERMIWESQAASLSLLSEQTVTKIYIHHDQLRTFSQIREEMQRQWGLPDTQKLWEEFIQWKDDFRSQSPAQQQQAHTVRTAMEKQCLDLQQQLEPLWKKANDCYQQISSAGNPIPR